jgi:hypothetical protein
MGRRYRNIWYCAESSRECVNAFASEPAYYSNFYAHELEMMYFLIEPLFLKSEAFTVQQASNEGLQTSLLWISDSYDELR